MANYGAPGLEPRKPAQAAQTDPMAALNMEERKDPKFIKFGDGEVIQGVLVTLERIMVGNPPKPATRYTVLELTSQEPVSFLGTYQLDSKLRQSDIGHVIDVRCLGVDKNVSRNGNAMIMFSVKVSSRPAPGWANDGTPITDSDFPEEMIPA
jgi:hypothetical protein